MYVLFTYPVHAFSSHSCFKYRRARAIWDRVTGHMETAIGYVRLPTGSLWTGAGGCVIVTGELRFRGQGFWITRNFFGSPPAALFLAFTSPLACPPFLCTVRLVPNVGTVALNALLQEPSGTEYHLSFNVAAHLPRKAPRTQSMLEFGGCTGAYRRV